jgi:hypothetical protein
VADILWGMLFFVLRTLDVVLGVMEVIDDVLTLARAVQGKNGVVRVPVETKVLPAAALRALAEAGERRRQLEQTARDARGAQAVNEHVVP